MTEFITKPIVKHIAQNCCRKEREIRDPDVKMSNSGERTDDKKQRIPWQKGRDDKTCFGKNDGKKDDIDIDAKGSNKWRDKFIKMQ